MLPEGADPAEWESKGFGGPRTIVDFPIRGRNVSLVMRRRRWRHTSWREK
ncbi:hypothetical protein RZS08_33895 [Arthrospira platensis SPKY1]|nr:hypothetical protein [Arthrospira platensis SPKY1]